MELDERWTITGHLNGGYLTAVIAAAAGEALQAPPLTASMHFLAATRGGGPADLAVEVVRRGWLSTARVTLSRDGTALVDGFVTAGEPAPTEPVLDHAPPPDMPAWDKCPDAGNGISGAGMDILHHLELRPHPDDAATLSGGASHQYARVRGWVAYRDGAPTDEFLVASSWDLLPPAPWVAGIWGRLPTVSAQVVLYAGAAPGPLLVEVRCDNLAGGVADETARVWDSTGRLVASGRQTAILLPS